ncbi:hypothetical protein KZ820_14460 [Sphingomonas sp. RRHST34]|uniref:SGNH hydrolase-type esterase domain-containing protein n=1 Tax=Sphingomonas citri TaxID=2862499 RepID=A0ABS7BQT3_9SPHN|nr:GDSL-type esterase/lipase family protein [Sphingomonas citri]MBW6531941.1 hypothetical protein [Sphingomonas citri]
MAKDIASLSTADKSALLAALVGAGMSAASSYTVDFFGDSQAGENSNANQYRAVGRGTQGIALSKGRFRFGRNLGVGGQTTTQVRARLNDVLTSPNGIVSFACGGNDLPLIANGTQSIQITIDNYKAMLDAILATGKRVNVDAIPPRTQAALTSGGLSSAQAVIAAKVREGLNRWLAQYVYAKSPTQVVFTSYDAALIDRTTTNGEPQAGFVRDGIHATPLGATTAGAVWLASMSAFAPPATLGALSQSDIADATYNPGGAMNVNPLLIGTAGTASGGVTGTVPTSFSANRESGTTATAVASTDGSSLTLTLGGATGGAASERLRVQGDTVNAGANTFAPGDVVFMEVFIDQANLVNVQSINLLLRANDGTTQSDILSFLNGGGVTEREAPNASRRLISLPYTIPAYSGSGTQRVTPYVKIDVAADGAGASGTITIRGLAVRKIPAGTTGLA